MTMAWDRTIVRAGSSLTTRERQVVELLASGRTRKEVAYALGIAHSTVRVLYARAVKRLERDERSDDLPGAARGAPVIVRGTP
jgi:DNA-binding NarL/FixJ family response regulator